MTNDPDMTAWSSTSSPEGRQDDGSPYQPPSPDPRRWKALAVLGLFQFMLILDVTVVNIALPSIQSDLDFTPSALPWVVNGYVIMAGGLLLLGGRLADVHGRLRVFLIGVGVFGVASLASGLAPSSEVLIAARFAQGVGDALAAPAALGLIALLFTDPQERGKAFGIWGGLAGLGGVAGNLVSGTLVEWASWRWIFLINIPVAVVVLWIAPRLTSESRMTRTETKLDFSGAIAGTLGLIAVVYGLLQVIPHSWGSLHVVLPLIGGLALIGAMLVREATSSAPLIPLSFFRNRTRLVANVSTLVSTAGFFTYAFLLTLYEQNVLGYSPLKCGLSYLPFAAAIGVGIGMNNGLMPKLGIRTVLSVGLFGSALGLALTSQISESSNYLTAILPGMIILGLMSGLALPASASAALHEVDGQNSGLAAAVQNVMQQVGAALGIAVLAALAFTRAKEAISNGEAAASAEASGYGFSLGVGAGFMVVAGILVATLLGKPKASPWGA